MANYGDRAGKEYFLKTCQCKTSQKNPQNPSLICTAVLKQIVNINVTDIWALYVFFLLMYKAYAYLCS